MRIKKFSSNNIRKLLLKQKISTMPELKAALGTDVNMTVIRKLRELSYLTSYSHRGGYYTLNEIVDFNSQGLWSYKSALFSIFGTLLKTCKSLIENSEAGYSARELKKKVRIEIKQTLLHLFREKQIQRNKISGRYIYFASDSKTKKKQLICHKLQNSKLFLTTDRLRSDLLTDEITSAIILFFSMLDEKQRRLHAGLESLRIGYGGDKKIAELFDIDPHTVAKGRREIQLGEFEKNRIRKKGAGRISVEKKIPK